VATVTDTEIRHHQPWWVGLIFFVIGSGIVIGGIVGGVEIWDGGWILFLVGGIFALIGFGVAVWVEDLRIDLLGRHWTYRRGWRWAVKDDAGDFGAFEGLTFKRERRSSGGKNSSSYTVWVVYLAWQPAKGYPDLNLHESRTEIEAHGKLEELGKRLDLKMIDMTGATPEEISPDEADLTLKDRARLARDAGGASEQDLSEMFTPPPGAKTTVDVALDGVHITFPRGASRAAGCFLAFFALFWNSIVWGMLLAFIFGGEIEGDMPAWLIPLFLLPFIAVGIAVAFGALWMFLARPHLEVSPDSAVSYTTFLSKTWSRKELPAGEIEEVKISREDDGSTALAIRTDEGMIKVGGRATETELRWLEKLVTQIISS